MSALNMSPVSSVRGLRAKVLPQASSEAEEAAASEDPNDEIRF